LERFDKTLLDKILADIINDGAPVTFDDIAGLDFAKKCVNELICWCVIILFNFMIWILRYKLQLQANVSSGPFQRITGASKGPSAVWPSWYR
jgi:hypothetical protein